MTLALPQDIALHVLHAVRHNDSSPLLTHYTKDSLCLYTTSRNNHLEGGLVEVVREFGEQSVAYLGLASTALVDQTLTDAIRGTQNLITAAEATPSRFVAALEEGGCLGGYTADEVHAAFANRPPTVHDATKTFQFAGGGDHDDLPAVAAFFHGHLAVLEAARERNLSVAYLLWLY